MGGVELVFLVNGKMISAERVTLVAQWYDARDIGSEVMGEPIMEGTEIDAVLRFIRKSFPEGWRVQDGEVVSGKGVARARPEAGAEAETIMLEDNDAALETYEEMEF